MMSFISFLRAIAACLITNSHYTDIYPLEMIANGGLLGDVIFFAVSGYCLYHIKLGFCAWYSKRLLRCYMPVILCTIVYIFCGTYKLGEWSVFEYFLYPTYYHFISSIVILYVPFYIVMKATPLRARLPLVMAGVAVVMTLVYIFLYDKSYYHIDNVRQWMIRFLFFESMLLGAFFRQKDHFYRNKFSIISIFGTIFFCGAYFACKLALSKGRFPTELQILNQVLLFGFLISVFRLFMGLDGKLSCAPKWLNTLVDFLADRTLEIYVVQYVLIDLLRPVGRFPLNWICITGAILFSASLLNLISNACIRRIVK